MSRYSRDESSRDPLERARGLPASQHREAAPADRADGRDRAAPARTWSAAYRFELPRTPERQPVILQRSRFLLRNSESELLASIAHFRAIAVRDLTELAAGDIRSLRDQRLLQTHGLILNGRAERVVVLTPTGRELLDRSLRSASRDQRFRVGFVKPRELEHDVQLYRMFRTEREQLEAEGATVTRVVLDHELTAEYQGRLHETHPPGADPIEVRRAFAEAHHLPFFDDRVHFPDLRVEYETADGRTGYRDLELATEHYSRAQVSARLGAGFRVYRAAAAGPRRGAAPSDPHHLERIT